MTEFVVTNGKRIVVGVIGGTVVLFGLVLLFIPGPGLVIIAAGLAVLATEFVWASRLLKRVRKEGGELVNNLRGKPKAGRVDAEPTRHTPTRHNP
jgi:uncharacterized protein (TIGR02611 family)